MNTCSSPWPAQSMGGCTTPSLLSPGVLTFGAEDDEARGAIAQGL